MTEFAKYPSLAEIKAAGLVDLQDLTRRLPPPQTDVQHTIKRRIELRINELAGEQMRKISPDFVDRFNRVLDRMDAMGIPRNGVEKL